MRKFVFVAVSAAAIVAGTAPAATAPPTLKVVSQRPLVVHATHFRAKERVRVSVRVDGSVAATRVVTSSRTGTFSASLGSVAYDRCTTGVVIRAAGSRGTLAVAKLPQLQCAPQLDAP